MTDKVLENEPLDLPFVWLGEEEWEKLLWDFKSKVGSFLGVFTSYGYQDYLPHVLGQIMTAFVDATMVLRGEDRPIAPNQKPTPRPTD